MSIGGVLPHKKLYNALCGCMINYPEWVTWVSVSWVWRLQVWRCGGRKKWGYQTSAARSSSLLEGSGSRLLWILLVKVKALLLINRLSGPVVRMLCFFICVPAHEHRSPGVPGDSRCSATEGRRASHAQHRSHSALWKLSEEEENLSQQDAHWRGSQTNRSVCLCVCGRSICGVIWTQSLTPVPSCSPQACPCTTPRWERLWTTSWDTWTRRWAVVWCSPACRCSTKSQRTWSRMCSSYKVQQLKWFFSLLVLRAKGTICKYWEIEMLKGFNFEIPHQNILSDFLRWSAINPLF